MTKSRQVADFGAGGFYAGKNKIINGDFSIWQRGATFNTSAAGVYTADRWLIANAESAGANVSRSTFTAGTAPTSGYESQYFLTFAKNGTTADKMGLAQRIEDVRTFAGQTVTISYWMKASTNLTNEPLIQQNFGSGGSSEVYTTTATQSITTSWTRYSVSIAIPSVSGKTIGTSSFVSFWPLRYTGSSNVTIDIWGVQVEAGSVATPFTTATGTLAGELAACQRYFQILGGDNVYEYFGIGVSMSVTESNCVVPLKVTMRSAPTTTFTTASNYKIVEGVGAGVACTSVAGDILTKNTLAIQFQSTNNLNTYRANRMMSNNTTSATIQISAEL